MARQLHPAGSLTYSTSENTDNRSLLVVAGALSQTLNLDSISLVVQGLAGDRMITAAKAAPSERSVPADVGHSPPPRHPRHTANFLAACSPLPRARARS